MNEVAAAEVVVPEQTVEDVLAPRLKQGTFGTNAAHQLLNQIGGHPIVMMMLGYHCDHTTQPKKPPKSERKTHHYGKNLMAHYDEKRRSAQPA